MDAGYSKAIAIKNQIQKETEKFSLYRLELMEGDEWNLDSLLESRKKRQKTETGWKIDFRRRTYFFCEENEPVRFLSVQNIELKEPSWWSLALLLLKTYKEKISNSGDSLNTPIKVSVVGIYLFGILSTE